MRRFAVVIIALLGAMVLPAAHAARVTPMVVVLDETGAGSATRIEVANTDDTQLPVEVRVFRGEIGERGELTMTPADDAFLVFPPQAVISPLGQQVFRLQYLPDAPLTQSETYFMSVRQIPVELEPGSSRIQLVTNFNVLVNVVPENVEANPSVDWIQTAEVDGVKGVEVRVVNSGSMFFAAGRNALTLRSARANGTEFSKTFSVAEIGETVGYGVVAPGKARIFFLPLDEEIDPSMTTIEFGR